MDMLLPMGKIQKKGLKQEPRIQKLRKSRRLAYKDIRPLKEVVDDYLVQVLESCNWNKTEAAFVLGVRRQTLYDMIKRAGSPKPKTQRGKFRHGKRRDKKACRYCGHHRPQNGQHDDEVKSRSTGESPS